MRIVIIGAGNTGKHLTAKFCTEQHDVIVIDTRQARLDVVADQYDVLTICGSGIRPHVLEEAQLQKADMLVAVTNHDEVNILACALANAVGVENKIARVSSTDLLHYDKFSLHDIGVDLAVNQKEECAHDLFNIIRMPGAIEVIDLKRGHVLAVGIAVQEGSPPIGTPLSGFDQEQWVTRIRLIGLKRGEEVSIPYGETVVNSGDEIYFVGSPEDCRRFMMWQRPDYDPFSKVVIAGGGSTGIYLAQKLEQADVQVVVLENNRDQAEICSDILQKSLVLNVDTLQADALKEIGNMGRSAFVAVTGDDENNIISCLLARQTGIAFAAARVNKPEYVPVMNGLNLLDRAISSHSSMINAILHFVRGKYIKSAVMMHRLPGELLDVVITDDGKWSNTMVRDIRIPRGSIIALVSRNGVCHIPTGDFELCAGDHLVIFAMPNAQKKIQSIFKK